MITLFSAAYMAETIRGGLQGLHPGQAEAARALGLAGWQTTLLISLPQAVRNVIPAIVGQFIGLFKDTSLVYIIGMVDVVEIGTTLIRGNPEYRVSTKEVVRLPGVALLGLHLRDVVREQARGAQPGRGRSVKPAGLDAREHGAEAKVTQVEESPATDDIILCRDVHKWFGRFHVLQGVTTSVGRGEVVVIVGPSGSGKSTFIRTINRLETHQRGDIIVDGVEMTDDIGNIDAIPPRGGDGVPVVQSLSAPERDPQHHAGADQGCESSRWPRRRTPPESSWSGSASPSRPTSTPASCRAGSSNGWPSPAPWRCSPRSCCSTRPTSALDPEMIKEVLDVMRELATSGMTMVVVSHEIGFAREVADRMLMFDEGVIVEEAAPDEFFNNSRHERTREFLSQILA